MGRFRAILSIVLFSGVVIALGIGVTEVFGGTGNTTLPVTDSIYGNSSRTNLNSTFPTPLPTPTVISSLSVSGTPTPGDLGGTGTPTFPTPTPVGTKPIKPTATPVPTATP